MSLFLNYSFRIPSTGTLCIHVEHTDIYFIFTRKLMHVPSFSEVWSSLPCPSTLLLGIHAEEVFHFYWNMTTFKIISKMKYQVTVTFISEGIRRVFVVVAIQRQPVVFIEKSGALMPDLLIFQKNGRIQISKRNLILKGWPDSVCDCCSLKTWWWDYKQVDISYGNFEYESKNRKLYPAFNFVLIMLKVDKDIHDKC